MSFNFIKKIKIRKKYKVFLENYNNTIYKLEQILNDTELISSIILLKQLLNKVDNPSAIMLFSTFKDQQKYKRYSTAIIDLINISDLILFFNFNKKFLKKNEIEDIEKNEEKLRKMIKDQYIHWSYFILFDEKMRDVIHTKHTVNIIN